ncbi:MAG: leucine-rich repeat protein [Clostridia bacterium]|nr:leucine-rich repeat protein [Clostridia bacterium]
MKTKSKKEKTAVAEEPIVLDIPEEEIWTYQIEGLAAPHINKPYKNYTLKKIVFTLTIIIAVSLSMFFTIRTVQKDTFEYEPLANNTYQFSKFSNTGNITELDIDYVTTAEVDKLNPDKAKIIKDETKVVTEIREYALNCDEAVQVINIGKDVAKIDGKAFYSCWALQRIEVDEDNPYFCDVDGVLYNKDKTKLICHPCDRDTYLSEKYGHKPVFDDNGQRTFPVEGDKEFEAYKRDVLTYIVPSTVETIGELAFNYAYLQEIYLPEGLKRIETLGIFEIPLLENIYSYKPNSDINFETQNLGEIYLSLPEGLEYIGSDAFSYNQAMSYVYIPSSVKYIGHHAFWDTVYKEDGNLKGVTQIDIGMSEEEFKNVECGDQWKPQYDHMLFKKSVDEVFDAQRKTM